MRKLVLRNGKIYVERGRFAQALYAEDGVIQAVGTEEEVLTAAGKRDGSGNGLDGAEIIDLEGRTGDPWDQGQPYASSERGHGLCDGTHHGSELCD